MIPYLSRISHSQAMQRPHGNMNNFFISKRLHNCRFPNVLIGTVS